MKIIFINIIPNIAKQEYNQFKTLTEDEIKIDIKKWIKYYILKNKRKVSKRPMPIDIKQIGTKLKITLNIFCLSLYPSVLNIKIIFLISSSIIELIIKTIIATNGMIIEINKFWIRARVETIEI